ncbi:MAG: DUF1569 domain-containing protein [Ginsengibacter sp.]
MEVKNLFDQGVKQDIVDRINKLTPGTQSLWGKMNVEQMLAHAQRPIGVAFGTHQLKGNVLIKVIAPFFKSVLYNEKPYKHGLPTDKSYIVTDQKNFEIERNKLIDMLEQFNEENITTNVHPVFGKLTKEQLSKATWKHLDHHLQQFGV